MASADHVDGGRVVAHLKNRKLLKGSTHDFFPGKPTFHLTSDLDADRGKVHEVKVADLKALFFVKSLEGNREYHETNRFRDVDTSHLKGLRIQLHFKDGEIMRGTTLDYNAGKKGFFVNPVDPMSNNTLVYVVTDAVEEIRLASDVIDEHGMAATLVWDSATKFID